LLWPRLEVSAGRQEVVIAAAAAADTVVAVAAGLVEVNFILDRLYNFDSKKIFHQKNWHSEKQSVIFTTPTLRFQKSTNSTISKFIINKSIFKKPNSRER
jgi:hypothetical protein